MASRMKDKYRQDVAPSLHKEFSYANPMQIPSINKIVVNIGMGDAV